jgi:methyltransferase (TIGR00027 family)
MRLKQAATAEAITESVSQFVILGAGLDTFAFRQPAVARRLEVYEVDHPPTQAWERERLAAAGVSVPDNLCWVPIDFEQQTLWAADASEPTFFSWGVIQYLTLPAIGATLRVVAALPSPSTIVLSFMLPDIDPQSEEAAGARQAANDAARAGEPWLTRITRQDLAFRLTELGFAR